MHCLEFDICQRKLTKLELELDNDTPTFPTVFLSTYCEGLFLHQRKDSAIIKLNFLPWSYRPLDVVELIIVFLPLNDILNTNIFAHSLIDLFCFVRAMMTIILIISVKK